jgi:hypothetical protein
MSKIYILRPIKDWEPWYDCCFGVVVCAKDEAEARTLAVQEAGDEGKNKWQSSKWTSCVELKPTSDSKVIIRDFAAS